MNQFPSAFFNTKPVPASETKTIKMAKISISAEKPKSREDWRTLVVN